MGSSDQWLYYGYNWPVTIVVVMIFTIIYHTYWAVLVLVGAILIKKASSASTNNPLGYYTPEDSRAKRFGWYKSTKDTAKYYEELMQKPKVLAN